jgi:hypothetical protein
VARQLDMDLGVPDVDHDRSTFRRPSSGQWEPCEFQFRISKQPHDVGRRVGVCRGPYGCRLAGHFVTTRAGLVSGRISSIARTSVAKMRSGQAIVEELILAAGCHPD